MSVSDLVQQAHDALRKAVPATRRKQAREWGPLAQTFAEAMRIVDAMKAQGATREQCLETVETILKQAWPKGRSEPWHYTCEDCQDSGWRARICTPQMRCGRPFKLPSQSADDWTGRGQCPEGHRYVEPCYCEKGQVFRAQMMKRPRHQDEDVERAARTSKPTRIGRG